MLKFLLIAVLVSPSGDEYASVLDLGLTSEDCGARLVEYRPVVGDDGSITQYGCVVDWSGEAR